MRGIRRHLTFANVASAIALFAVIGGGAAFALPGKNSVNSGDVRNNSLRPVDLKDGRLTSADALGGRDGARAYGIVSDLGGAVEVQRGHGIADVIQPVSIGDPTGIVCISLDQEARRIAAPGVLVGNSLYVGLAENDFGVVLWRPDTPNCRDDLYEVNVLRISADDGTVSLGDDAFVFAIH